jgi:hypothetical protein
VGALATLSFAGFALSIILIFYYIYQAKNILTQTSGRSMMQQYYQTLIPTYLGIMTVFISIFAFNWYFQLIPLFDWIRIVIDIIQFIFLGFSFFMGKKLAQQMARIQKEHGL